MKSIISQYITLHIKRLLIVLVAVISFSLEAEAQGVIRFTGRVVSKQTGEPLIGVNITDIKLRRALAVTDEDGRFSMNTQIGAQLRFSMIGAKPEILKVKNDKFTEVKLNEDDITLGEVVVKTMCSPVLTPNAPSGLICWEVSASTAPTVSLTD